MSINTFTTRHGTFRAGEEIWHEPETGEPTRAGIIRDVGPAFSVFFHDARGVHLVPAGEVRKPGRAHFAPLPPDDDEMTLADILRAAIGRRRQKHLVIRVDPHVGPLPNPFPKVHKNREKAEREAARLAALYGGTFVVFAAVAKADPDGLHRLAD